MASPNRTTGDHLRVQLMRGFAVVWLSTLIGGLGIGMVSPLLPIFAEEMGASGVWLGLAFAGFSISQTPLMPFIGRLSDRFGRKLFLAVGMLIYAFAALGYLYSPTYQLLVIFRIFSGVGAAMFVPVAFAYIGDLSPSGREGRYMGLFNIAFLMGWGAGPIIGGLVKDALGADATFLAMMLMSAAAFALIILFFPRPQAADPRNRPREIETPWLQLFRDRMLMAVCSFELIFGLSFGAMFSFLPVFMTSNLGTTATAVGIVISTRALLNGVLIYPYGWLADRMNRVSLIIVGAVVTAAGTFAVPWMTTFVALLALLSITAILESMALPATNAIVVERGRELGMGSVMGIFNMFMGVGVLLGSVVGGLVQDFLGVENVFRFSAVAILGGIGVFYTLMKQAQRNGTMMPLDRP